MKKSSRRSYERGAGSTGRPLRAHGEPAAMASTHDFGDARTGARGDWQSRIICAVVVHGSTAWATTGAICLPDSCGTD
jgi:hypothetical protein